MSSTTLALVVALVSVLMSPLIQLITVRAQIRVQVMSANRQQWINTIRDEIASLLSDIKFMRFSELVIPAGEWFGKAAEVLRRESKIRLLINPKEEDHTKLVNLISEAVTIVSKPGKPDSRDTDRLGHLDREIIEQSQKILKREWERVKTGG